MKNYLLSLIVLAAIFMTSLPLSVQASVVSKPQTQNETVEVEAMGPVVEPVVETINPQTFDYNDDNYIFRAKQVYVSSVDLIVGASPQVPGGLKTAPAAGEEDVDLDKRILVMTATSRNNVYIGWLNPTSNGKQVKVRRIKATKKIIAIINCGNWTREIGASYTFECSPVAGPCVPGETKTSTEELVSDDGLTVTVIKTTTDGCKTTIEKVITKTVKETKEVCKEGSLDPVPLVNISGQVKDSFKVADQISQFTSQQQQEILSKIGQEKINGLLIFRGACETEREVLSVHWFAKKGSKWNWMSFLVGVGAGFLGGYLIKRTRNNPTPAIKTPFQQNTRTGISGSGSTSGGSVGTRRTRPR